ncbi:MAG: glycosyltransferase [Candidatus Pacebacteria bacterium]|nr:glycosyltransferase [Candidatus Paceibacterota bacterium]
MSTKPFLAVIIPSYNEQNNLKRGVLDQVVGYLKKQDYSWEIILSDDGSTDGTLTELKKFAQAHQNVKVLANTHAGKGPTVKAGMLAAQAAWRLYTDFDQSTPLKEVKKLLRYVPDYDVIFGSREMIGAKREKEPFYRHLMGRVWNIVVQALAIPGMLDTQCGFKMFSAEATEKLFNALYVYSGEKKIKAAYTGAFDVELLYLANKFNYRIREVPIKWQHYQTERVNPVRDSLLMLRDILKIRKADLAGKYKA